MNKMDRWGRMKEIKNKWTTHIREWKEGKWWSKDYKEWKEGKQWRTDEREWKEE